MNNVKKLLGKKIQSLRRYKNLTQEELAEKIGLNNRSLSLIECGKNFVTSETLEKICYALDTTPKRLFDFDEDFINKKKTKEALIELIGKNEDKIFDIYKIIKGFLE